MKRTVIIILAIATLMFSLTSCNSEDGDEISSDPTVLPNTAYNGTVSGISTTFITISTDSGDVTIELTDTTNFSREIDMNMPQPDIMGEFPSDMGEIPMGGERPDSIESFTERPENSTPPDKPDEAPETNDQNAAPPELPEANGQDVTPPEIPSGESNQQGMNSIENFDPQSITIKDFAIGNNVSVETDSEGKAASVILIADDLNDFGQMQQHQNIDQIPDGMTSGIENYSQTESN